MIKELSKGKIAYEISNKQEEDAFKEICKKEKINFIERDETNCIQFPAYFVVEEYELDFETIWFEQLHQKTKNGMNIGVLDMKYHVLKFLWLKEMLNMEAII